MNLPPECAECQKDCRVSFSGGMTTCAYYPPTYDKTGRNVNPDMNTTSGSAVCLTCGEQWNYSSCNGVTTWTKCDGNSRKPQKKAELTEKQRELYELMSQISQDGYCARWMRGCEYAIWNALQSGCRRYGIEEIGIAQFERCRTLSEELNGWIIWYDEIDEPGLPVELWGARFVPMDEWLTMSKKNISVQVPFKE